MSRTTIQIGPADAGKQMALDDFEHAEAQSGFNYELGRGRIAVVDVPDRKHLAMVDAASAQFYAYRPQHPSQIHTLAAGGECKILLAEAQSERHPDLAIYKTAPEDAADLWATWIPEIVIEVVSPGSHHRDYVEKREEYLSFCVREYWIIDAASEEMLVLRRVSGRWTERTVSACDKYATRLLAGLEFDLASVFRAANG